MSTVHKIWCSDELLYNDPGVEKELLGYEPEIPSYQEMNFIMNKISKGLNDVLTEGMFDWDSTFVYEQYAKVKNNGFLWKAKVVPTVGLEPSTVEWTLDDGHTIGDILMYDKNDWIDNVTKPGWYACISGNVAHGCPDLVNKFIRGSSAGVAGDSGGSDNKTLNTSTMPSHTHPATITGTGSHSHSVAVYDTGSSTLNPTGNIWNDAGGDTNMPSAGSEHTHTYNTSSYTGSGTSFSIVPKNYKLLYIRKCE